MDWKKTLLICTGILAAGALLTLLIFSTEPTAQQTGATKTTAMLVDVTDAESGSYNPTIRAMGTVEPSQDIMLRPRVSGEIIDRSADFTPGGYVEKGDTLLQINPADYRNTLQQRKSEMQQAESQYNIELGRQRAAQREYQLLGDTTLSEANKALILRKPQLQSAEANLQSAKTAVEQARLNLERTTITAPFDAHVLTRNVNMGSQVAAGDNLGRLVGLDHYWVEATVPLSMLRWLNIPDGNALGSQVRIHNRTAWEDGEYRTGYLHKVIGSLAEQTRMARVIISVPDPQAYEPENAEKPKLMIGSFVEANITAEEVEDVVRLSRDYIRQNDTVWVMDDGELSIRDVNIVLRDARFAYISDGLSSGEQIVTTNLTSPTDGAPLRLVDADTTGGESSASTTAD